MKFSCELPKKCSTFPLPPNLQRVGAAACSYDDSILIYGGATAWLQDEEYDLSEQVLIRLNPWTRKTRPLSPQPALPSSMNPALCFDTHSDTLLIMPSEHSASLPSGQVGWQLQMGCMTSRIWEGPAEARFFASEAWGYDSAHQVFYTFHLAGESAAAAYQVFYAYSVPDNQWKKIAVPPEVLTRHSAGGLYIPEHEVFVIFSGYFWDAQGRPSTCQDMWLYYPARDQWEQLAFGEQIGCSQSTLHFDPEGDRIIILQGSPNGVSRSHQVWQYLFHPRPPRGHCRGHLSLLCDLPVTLPIRPVSFIAQQRLLILGGTQANSFINYGLSLDLRNNPGSEVQG